MRKILVALGLLAVMAAVAGAQTAGTNTQARGGHYFNATTGQQTTANGEVLSEDNLYTKGFANTNIIARGGLAGTTTIAAAGADSSSVLDTRLMRLGMLCIKAIPANAADLDTTTAVKLVFQIRTHLNGVSDSVNTFAIYQYGKAPIMNEVTAGAATAADTSTIGHLYKAVPLTATTATPSVNSAWSGEFTVIISRSRTAVGSSVAINGRTFYYPSGIAISLSSLFGRDVYSPWTSIRVRNASATSCDVYVSLIGTPL